MYVSPEDVAYAEGYVACFFSDPANRNLIDIDEWFGRGGIDFNLHNYTGELVVDAYEYIDGQTITDRHIRVLKIGE